MVDQALVAARMSAARLRARRGDLSPIPSRAVRAIHLGRFVLCLWPCHRLGRCRRRMPGTLEQLLPCACPLQPSRPGISGTGSGVSTPPRQCPPCAPVPPPAASSWQIGFHFTGSAPYPSLPARIRCDPIRCTAKSIPLLTPRHATPTSLVHHQALPPRPLTLAGGWGG